MLARQPRHDVGRDRRRIAERPVVMPDQRVDEIDRRRRHAKLGVFGLEALGHPPRKRGFVVAGSPSKPMLNVLTGADVSRLIRPTTIVESTPPLRNAPSGTSLTSRRSTARVTRSRTPASLLPSIAGRSACGNRAARTSACVRVHPPRSSWRCRARPVDTLVERCGPGT